MESTIQGTLDEFIDQFHSIIVNPPLTSITHPSFEIGQEAARLFFRQTENPETKPEQVVLNTKLVVRESSAK